MSKKAIVLISGGMDSLVTTAIAKNEGYELYGLHLNYKQRTEKKELKSFKHISHFYHIRKTLVVDVAYLSQIGGSALTDKKIPILGSSFQDIPMTYVPFRNTHIIAIAVSWAEVIGAEKIFIGAVEEDSSGYPDCREDYYQAYNQLIEVGTKPKTHIKIITPLIHMSKKEIVIKGHELGAPFHLSWSCYSNSHKACGVCDSCRLRLKGFQEANLKDPIPYK